MKLYGEHWPKDATELEIEFACIRNGGRWVDPDGYSCGQGLYHHYRRVWNMLWPEDDEHRWSVLGLQRMVENPITVFMGASDSNKTWLISKFVMSDWWVDPYKTLWMCSSTERRGAELRIWGKLKEFFNRGRERHPYLVGTVLESKGCITPDQISDDGSEGRLLTRGIMFIPCKSGTQWLGLGPWAGIKPPANGRMGHAGDEVQLMLPSFLDAYANWYGKENFRGLLTGNPGDMLDPLCVAGEPLEGWDSWKDTGKTQEWKGRFYGAHVVAFDGRDTPNNDFPYVGGKARFHYLIGKKKIDAVKAQYGENDWHFWQQCVGKPQTSVQSRRVITRQLAEISGAFGDVIWAAEDKITKLVSLDAAYGGIGGDRCVLRLSEFGQDVEGATVFACNEPKIVPINIRLEVPAEVQIAKFCKTFCELNGVPPENFFFDGRGTLAIILAQEWSTAINVVDFGGKPTKRPVSNDEYVWEGDTMSKRLKTCDEEYFNFVTELWFAVYYLMVTKQLRRLDKETAREGYQRTWDNGTSTVRRTLKQVEPKHIMKERTKQSPDLMDCAVIGVEGARRLGFQIESMNSPSQTAAADDWLQKELDKHRSFVKRSQLSYSSS